MTGHQIDNFVGSLVEMAKAFEERPMLIQRIELLEREANERMLANHALEDSNNILRNHIDELNLKIREVTQERDDASFRVLEAEDKAATVLDLAKTLQSGLGQVIVKLEPPKPEVVEPVISVQTDPMPVDIQPAPVSSGEASQSVPEALQGQSEANPTPTGLSGQPTSEPEVMPQTGTIQGSVSGEVSQANTSQSDKPYLGKRYRDVPGYVNRQDWLDGGGTEEDYYANV